MIDKDKITEIFYIIDEFSAKFDAEIEKNQLLIMHSKHRSINNFIMNLIAALGAYCFFENKPSAIEGYTVEKTNQLVLF